MVILQMDGLVWKITLLKNLVEAPEYDSGQTGSKPVMLPITSNLNFSSIAYEN